jgi:uncharacterized protein YgiM (DUF1202 family)
MSKRIGWLFLSLCSLSVWGAEQGSQLYVRSSQAKLMEAPAFSAALVTKVPKGSVLELVKKKGSWYRVKYQDNSGWVSKFLVSKKKPKAKIIVSTEEDATVSKGRSLRKRASSISTAAAARGLAADEENGVVQRESDREALERIESFEISEEDLEQFMDALAQ